MYNKGPFATWVPKPIMLLLIIIFLLPLLALNGIYTSNISDISGALATYSEYISMANNATTIGMAVAGTIVMRVKMRFRSKEIIVFCTVVVAGISYLIGTTDNILMVIGGSFFIGLLKMFAMIEMMLPVMFILSPTGERGRFYSIFYPITIGIGQLSSYLMADLIFNSSWQAPYFYMSIMMLVIASLSLIFQHNQRFGFKKPLYQIDWLSLVLFSVSAMCLNAGLTFMRQQGWFSSPFITGSFLISVILLAALIYRQKFLKRKLIKFELIVQKVNVWHGMILLLFLGAYLASSSIFVQYTVGVLGYNNLINAKLNLWMIPGIVIAGFLAFHGFKNKWNVKYYIILGFMAFFLHTLMLYLMIQPQMNIEYLYFPMFIKGLGLGILFIGIWYYATLNLQIDDMLSLIGIMLLVRTFIATAFAGAIISWAAYQGQWQSLSDISVYLDTGDFSDGMSMYQTTQVNAMMASSKIVLGYLCWLIIPILIFVLTHHYGQFNNRRIVFLRKVIRGNRLRGYKFS
ncbi:MULTISPECIES: MFS transporter [unclassified Flavobacterium]|jgi:MFS family permease|uniref:MFS transporter n=1 Tax=unclassified Flavobacterium TaxID=196869 RepID=UPI000EB1D819|nr:MULTISPECIES: MFS transporter [unclassified Flavobacterium]RKS03002.1 MFS transporter [Flavobacterium sp. 102]